jgi:hypothetical protein
MSEKNTLQELCQKNKFPLPIYETWSIGTKTNELDWFARVIVWLKDEPETKEITIPCKTKIAAEKAAAAEVLKSINETKDDIVATTPTTSSNTIYLIDLENKPMFKLTQYPGSLYLGFITKTHHSRQKYEDWYTCTSDIINPIYKKQLFEIESGVSDVVDHLMTFMAYPLVLYLKNNNTGPLDIVIVSGDHAGYCTKACIETMLVWHGLSTTITVKMG